MTESTASPAEIFMELREQLFGGDLSALAPAQPDAALGSGPEVYGAAMEGGVEGGSYLVFGLRDGSASLYFSGGGGAMGGHAHPHINAAAREFVETARAVLGELPHTTEHPIPADGRVRFSVFTSAGARAAEFSDAELETGEHELSPLFGAAHAVIAGFRELEQQEPASEPDYLNCLLTTLGRGTATSVTVEADAPLPDPAQFTEDEMDLDWIARLGFDFDTLSASTVIELLEDMAGFSEPSENEQAFSAKLADHGGETFTEVTFLVRRQRKGGRQQVEVTVQRPG